MMALSINYRSRKLWVFLLAFFVSAALILENKLSGAEWVNFAKWTLFAYVGGNVGEHYTKRQPGQDS